MELKFLIFLAILNLACGQDPTTPGILQNILHYSEIKSIYVSQPHQQEQHANISTPGSITSVISTLTIQMAKKLKLLEAYMLKGEQMQMLPTFTE